MPQAKFQRFLDNHLSWKVLGRYDDDEMKRVKLLFEESDEIIEVFARSESGLTRRAIASMNHVMAEYDQGLEDL